MNGGVLMNVDRTCDAAERAYEVGIETVCAASRFSKHKVACLVDFLTASASSQLEVTSEVV
jgi:hypothetical protein